MKNYDGKQALSIIPQAAKEYDDLLNDKHFLIVYRKDSQILTCCVGFRSFNFLHLTGIKTRMSASKFYSACLSGVLSTKDIEIDKKGKVQQKITVLPYLSKGYEINKFPEEIVQQLIISACSACNTSI